MTSYTTVSPTCLLPCWIVCKGINHVHLSNHHKLTHKFHTVISDLKKEGKEIAINGKVFPLSWVLLNHYFLGLEKKKSSWLALKMVTAKCFLKSNLCLYGISVFIRHHRIQINKAEGFFVLSIGNVCGLRVMNKSKATTAALVVKKEGSCKLMLCL